MRHLAIASIAVLAIASAAAMAAPDTSATSTDSASVSASDSSASTTTGVQATTPDGKAAASGNLQTDSQVASNPNTSKLPNPDAGINEDGTAKAAVTNGGQLAH